MVAARVAAAPEVVRAVRDGAGRTARRARRREPRQSKGLGIEAGNGLALPLRLAVGVLRQGGGDEQHPVDAQGEVLAGNHHDHELFAGLRRRRAIGEEQAGQG